MIFHFKKGFTLVELMIVIAVIGILAAVLFPSLTGYMARASDAALRVQLQKMQQKFQEYAIDNNIVYRDSPTGPAGGSFWCFGNSGCNWSGWGPILVSTDIIKKIQDNSTTYLFTPYAYAINGLFWKPTDATYYSLVVKSKTGVFYCIDTLPENRIYVVRETHVMSSVYPYSGCAAWQ